MTPSTKARKLLAETMSEETLQATQAGKCADALREIANHLESGENLPGSTRPEDLGLTPKAGEMLKGFPKENAITAMRLLATQQHAKRSLRSQPDRRRRNAAGPPASRRAHRTRDGKQAPAAQGQRTRTLNSPAPTYA